MLDSRFFVSTEIHQRDVTLPDGSVHTLHFKELPATQYRRFIMAERHADPDVRAASIVTLIAASMCDEQGNPAITLEQAALLRTAASSAIFEAVMDVNGKGLEKKSSTPEQTTTSGTS